MVGSLFSSQYLRCRLMVRDPKSCCSAVDRVSARIHPEIPLECLELARCPSINFCRYDVLSFWVAANKIQRINYHIPTTIFIKYVYPYIQPQHLLYVTMSLYSGNFKGAFVSLCCCTQDLAGRVSVLPIVAGLEAWSSLGLQGRGSLLLRGLNYHNSDAMLVVNIQNNNSDTFDLV